jgi:MAF protein
MMRLTLASQSPRRAKILTDLGIPFDIVRTDAEEISWPDRPEETVLANARAKLAACRQRPALAADTIVWFRGKIYGKPRDLAEAKTFLRELSGETHTVFTGVAFDDGRGVRAMCVHSDVTFHALTDEEIDAYVARVQPLDRAGAYDIDSEGHRLVASYRGSYENIMGLPVLAVRAFTAALFPPAPSARRRIGLFGGSFDPIHLGHIGIAERAADDWHLDKVLVIPAYRSPFKTEGPAPMENDLRWKLVQLACADHPRLVPCPIELARGGVSYAIDTVRAIREQEPDAELFYIIGEDNIAGLPKWHEPEALTSLCRFVTFPRTRESSTEIRRRLAAGEPIDGWVCPAVARALTASAP